jgi:hypothetical protein
VEATYSIGCQKRFYFRTLLAGDYTVGSQDCAFSSLHPTITKIPEARIVRDAVNYNLRTIMSLMMNNFHDMPANVCYRNRKFWQLKQPVSETLEVETKNCIRRAAESGIEGAKDLETRFENWRKAYQVAMQDIIYYYKHGGRLFRTHQWIDSLNAKARNAINIAWNAPLLKDDRNGGQTEQGMCPRILQSDYR